MQMLTFIYLSDGNFKRRQNRSSFITPMIVYYTFYSTQIYFSARLAHLKINTFAPKRPLIRKLFIYFGYAN